MCPAVDVFVFCRVETLEVEYKELMHSILPLLSLYL